MNNIHLHRREFLSMGIKGVALFAAGGLLGCSPSGRGDAAPFHSLSTIGPLLPPDRNGIMLPAGFASRIVARSSQPPLPGGAYDWHPAPDGGATYAAPDGGWVYVSNSEIPDGGGGVGALRFNRDGAVVDAYSILEGTSTNCAGGATPWGTWLSCEEVDEGQVFECDPFGARPAQHRPALGTFQHEAVAVDAANQCLYLTEDKPDGGFYRFRAAALPDLEQGVLEIARRETRNGQDYLVWVEVPDPAAANTPIRRQLPDYAVFNRGEGIAYYEGAVYFATTGDNRIWRYGVDDSRLDIIYDPTASDDPILSGVDNVVITPAGDVLVCEDGGDMQIVIITPDRRLLPLLQVTGQDRSEIAGAAFDPSHRRLYFSSQRGPGGRHADGITYEITRT